MSSRSIEGYNSGVGVMAQEEVSTVQRVCSKVWNAAIERRP